MKHWSIDRLSLTVPGYSERQAHELAQCVADALVEVTTLPTKAAASGTVSSLNLQVTAQDNESMADLARRVVATLASVV